MLPGAWELYGRGCRKESAGHVATLKRETTTKQTSYYAQGKKRKGASMCMGMGYGVAKKSGLAKNDFTLTRWSILSITFYKGMEWRENVLDEKQ
jgi:hypothetical protein